MADDDKSKRLRPIDAFKKHLESVGVSLPRCPICSSTQWAFLPDDAPLVVLQGYNEEEQAAFTVPAKAMAPVALLTCTTCYYVLPFAWQLIRRKTDG